MASLAPAPAVPFRQDASIIAIVGFAHGTSHFFHLMLPPLFPFFMGEFGIGFTEAGLLMTIFFLVSGIGQAIAGIWVDRYGAPRVLVAGMALLSLSGVLVAVAPSMSGLMLAAFVAGLGNSVFHPADFALLNKRVSMPRLGHAFSTHGLSGNLGWALAPVLMVATATAYGWRTAGWVAAAVGALALAVLISQRALLRYEAAESQATKLPLGARASLGDVLRSPVVLGAFAFFFFITFGFGALQNFAPSILRELFSLSLGAATSALSVYLVASAGGLVLGGFLAKPTNQHERLVALSIGAGALIALLIAWLPLPSFVVLPMMALMGFTLGIAGPSRDLLVRTATKARLGESAFGRVYGIVYSGLDAGLALAPIAFGLLLDNHLHRYVFVGIAISLVVAIGAAAFVAKVARDPITR